MRIIAIEPRAWTVDHTGSIAGSADQADPSWLMTLNLAQTGADYGIDGEMG